MDGVAGNTGPGGGIDDGAGGRHLLLRYHENRRRGCFVDDLLPHAGSGIFVDGDFLSAASEIKTMDAAESVPVCDSFHRSAVRE